MRSGTAARPAALPACCSRKVDLDPFPIRVRVLLTTFGSYGDLYPYIALGGELRRRAHEVTLATSALYRDKVESAGLRFHAIRPDVSVDDRDLLAYVMDARRGSERIVRYLASVVRDSYEDVAPVAAAADVILTHPITFGSVIAAEKLRVPWVSSVLAPISFLSAHDPCVVAPAPWMHKLRFLGPRFTKAWIALAKRQTLDWLRPVAGLREELGLRPGKNPLFEGQHAPLRVLALFSRLLAVPQPDWPPQTFVTGFCFLDETGEFPAALRHFLATGPPPIVFTLGSSAVATAGDFYRRSLNAVERLGARAVFLTGSHPQGLPEILPGTMIAVPYAPHAPLFAQAAALVHQGGIGTTGQAMRSGRPMLVVPFAHDQFDNAERVRRLGAAEVLPHSRYTAGRAEGRLQRLLTQQSYHDAAAKIRQQMEIEGGVRAAADAIENSLAGNRR
jgi:rhamnosyltransferase subunit B